MSQHGSNASLFFIYNKWSLNEQFALMLIHVDCVMRYVMYLTAVIMASEGLYVNYCISARVCVCVW